MTKLKAGIIGATGMVGQRLITLLSEHPYFEISVLAASASSAGKSYAEAIEGRWKMTSPLPDAAANMRVYDAADADTVAGMCDFVFCAVNMGKEETRALEEAYAKRETPVISNNSANRSTPDVPMLIPEINEQHLEVIAYQRKRLGTKNGFICVKPNCSIQSYVPMISPLLKYSPTRMVVSTYQAISGAGKTIREMPEMVDNVKPYIAGEEEKSEKEPLKVWGHVEDGMIIPAKAPVISAHCVRVPVSDGHLASVFVDFENVPPREEIIAAWQDFKGKPQTLALPSAPKQFITYFDEPDRPQTALDRDIEGGMGVAVGRLEEDSVFDFKFIGISHNTLRGAAGGGVLSAELLYREGYIVSK
ncbi:MAG: aspartate-semialdehyde dehydrogenase [Clostridiales bacterium]|nr:aspartate-semialdehyde dehydrogenase [Clostridiales bacterium]